MPRARGAFTGYYVPSWTGRARAKRLRAKTLSDLMTVAQAVVDAHEARVVTVFSEGVASPVFSYDVLPNVTRITWRASL